MSMRSGSWAAFCEAAPIEVYPGEPGGDCRHGFPDGHDCPDCVIEGLRDELRAVSEDADYWFDRFQEMCILVGAVAEDW